MPASGLTLPLPSPRVAAALVLTMLGAGVVIGRNVDAADAGAGRRIIVVYGAAPASPFAAPALTPPVLAAPDDAGDGAGLGDGLSGDGGLGDGGVGDGGLGSDDASGAGGDGTAGAPDTDAGGDPPATDEQAGDDVTGDDAPAPVSAPKLPPISHVWVVALTGHSYDETFGPGSPAPYLAQELRAKGTLLPWYHAAGHDPAAGGVALLGGQRGAVGPFGAGVSTLPGQLTGAGRTWRAYAEGATDGLAPGDDPCRRPADEQPRNPFLRFASITGTSECASSLASTGQLALDLADPGSTPAFSYILPGAAHDGSTGLTDADAWLRATVEPILATQAYADGGLVVITSDAGAPGDDEAGGGRVGALLLSPFVAAGGTVETPHDPFSLLRSIEDLFALEPLGYAAKTHLRPFGPKVYASYDAGAAAR